MHRASASGPGSYNLFDKDSFVGKNSKTERSKPSPWALSLAERLPPPDAIKISGDPGALEPRMPNAPSLSELATSSMNQRARRGKHSFLSSSSRVYGAAIEATPSPGSYNTSRELGSTGPSRNPAPFGSDGLQREAIAPPGMRVHTR